MLSCHPALRNRPTTVVLHCVQSMLPPHHNTATRAGLESSAQGGEGLGIETFRPAQKSVQLSPKMFLPEGALERLRAQVGRGARSCH